MYKWSFRHRSCLGDDILTWWLLLHAPGHHSRDFRMPHGRWTTANINFDLDLFSTLINLSNYLTLLVKMNDVLLMFYRWKYSENWLLIPLFKCELKECEPINPKYLITILSTTFRHWYQSTTRNGAT